MATKDNISVLTEQDKKSMLDKSVKALPSNPSDKGYSAQQIKQAQYEPSVILFCHISNLITELKTAFDVSDASVASVLAETLKRIETKKSIYMAKSGADLGNATNWDDGQCFLILDESASPKKCQLLQLINGIYTEILDFHKLLKNYGTNVLSANAIFKNSNDKKIIEVLANGNHQLYGSFPVADGITSSSTITQINTALGDKAVFMIANNPDDLYSFSISNGTYTIAKFSYVVLGASIKYQIYASQSDLTKTISDIFVNNGGLANSYTVETSNNKVSSITSENKNSESLFPSNKAITDYVEKRINEEANYFITKDASGNSFATKAELFTATTFYNGGVTRIPTRNDYAYVIADETHSNATTKYSYQGGTYPSGQWVFEVVVNETPLTQAQLNALNSGITSAKVSTYDGYAATIAGKSTVSVSDTGSATDEVQYITIDGVEKKLAGGEAPANMVTTDTDQVITSTKTIKRKPLQFTNSSDEIIGKIEYENANSMFDVTAIKNNLELKSLDNNVTIFSKNTSIALADYGSGRYFYPEVDGNVDLGISNYRWNDLWLKGVLSDGTNSITVANIASTTTTSDLQEQINNLKSRGRYLATWNAQTGLPTTDPTTELPYTYRTGDFYIVGVIGPGNFRPEGSSYTGSASITLETETLKVGDEYIYDGTNWVLLQTAPYDFSIFAKKADNETISGSWTFTQPIDFLGGIAKIGLKNASQLNLYSNGNDALTFESATDAKLARNLIPTVNNTYDIGSSTFKYNNVYANNLVTLADNQTISGVKTFSSNIIVKDGTGTNISISNTGWFGEIGLGTGSGISFSGAGIRPLQNRILTNNIIDIGSSFYKWKDLYLAGKLSDGTNEVTIANIKATLGSVITNTTDTTISLIAGSGLTYVFTQPITSATISSLSETTGDLKPEWNLTFIVGTGFALTLPTGVTWAYGTPTWDNGIEYSIVIKKSVTSGNYVAYQIRG